MPTIANATPTEAKAAYEEACRRWGENSSEALSALSDLGVAYKDQGDFEHATGAFARLAHHRLADLKRGDSGALLTALRLGVCIREIGDIERARVVHAGGLEIAIKYYGAGSDEAVTFASNLVGELAKLDEYEKVPELAQVLNARLASKDDDTLGMRRHLYFTANVFRYMGDFDLSLKVFRRIRKGGVPGDNSVRLVAMSYFRSMQSSIGLSCMRRFPSFDSSKKWKNDVARRKVKA